MEFFIFLALVVPVGALLLWRSRTRTSDGPESLTTGLPDDLRDKNTGLGSVPNHGRPWGGGS